jgi:hypothetical protein
MPLHYNHCATCDRPFAGYRGHRQFFCSRKCYFAFCRMVKVCIRDKSFRAQLISRSLELSRLAA